ncbi:MULTISPECIES: GTP pyrophosphokinase family protein [Corynebacterium]|uniref:GTP pyrophosphokinase n=1 Tax=Corynebacterium TaxID=1716 RepID=UPI00124D88AC|nr:MULTISPECIES: GTP pyrophosphokinase family protein [Corynebacterium]
MSTEPVSEGDIVHTPEHISALSDTYTQWCAAHPDAAERFQDVIEDLLTDGGITYDRVVARVKQWPSLEAKAYKRDAEGEWVYPHPWDDIHDILGVRVTTFYSTEIPIVIDMLGGHFHVLRSIDKTAQTRVSGSFGYGSHHLVVRVPSDHDDLEDFAGLTFEVQLRTVLQHAWAEFEHDIRYKASGVTVDPRVDRAFTLAAGLIELADQQFDQIASIQNPSPEPGDDVALTAITLPGVLAILLGSQFPRSKSEHYPWLEELLKRNGVTTVAELKELVNAPAIARLRRRLDYRFQPSQVRIVDDLLLDRFGEEHIARTDSTGNRAAQRPHRLARRLKRLRREDT